MKKSLLLIAMGVLVGGAGCETPRPGNGVEQGVRKAIETHGLRVSSVSCAYGEEARLGQLFYCTVTAEGVTFTEEAKKIGGDHLMEVRAMRVTSPPDIARHLQKQLRDKVPTRAAGVTVDCGSAVLKLAARGEQVTCTVRTDTASFALAVDITDDYGGWKGNFANLRPLSAAR